MYKRYYWLLALAIITYLGFTLAVPADPTTLAHYHISAWQLDLVGITLVIPIIVIWVTAFYGFIHFEDYAARIQESPDGRGLKAVADGLLFLGMGILLPSVVSSALQFSVANNILSQATVTVINTHVELVFPFVGFLLILVGTQRLLGTLKQATIPKAYDLAVAAITLVIGVVFGLLTLSDPARTTPAAGATGATYYLPDILIILTIVVPYAIIWGIGLCAALRLHAYEQNVPGKAYRIVLRTLERGIIAVIITSIGLQFLTTATAGLDSLNLGWALVLLYTLLAAIAVGYILIALGARKLKQVEELA